MIIKSWTSTKLYNTINMSKDKIDRADLHYSTNSYLSSLKPLPNSPIKMSFRGHILTVYFKRISDSEWNRVKIE